MIGHHTTELNATINNQIHNNQILLEREMARKAGWEQGDSDAELKRGKDVSM